MGRLPLTIVGFGALSWVLFGLAWGRVLLLHATVAPEVLLGLAAVLASVVLLNGAWIAHNRRIYRRKGPRRGLPASDVIVDTDRLGRPVTFAEGARDARVCVLTVEPDGSKRYGTRRTA